MTQVSLLDFRPVELNLEKSLAMREVVLLNLEASRGSWIYKKCQDIAYEYALKHDGVTVDEVREIAEMLYPKEMAERKNKQFLGGALAKHPKLYNTGMYKASRKVNCHGRPVAIFKVKKV